ncbi:MAG: PepSY domain-containing protein [Burkholderiaceae bacterium]|nr:PepSY domain-containing protein [Burkholderiaceae bacterium]
MRALRGWALSAWLLGAALAPAGAWASDRQDHERARAAVQAGEVLPLPVLLERLRASHPGRVLELELEREDGRWIYEVRLLQAGGQLLKLELDAATGQLLKLKRKDPHKDARKP